MSRAFTLRLVLPSKEALAGETKSGWSLVFRTRLVALKLMKLLGVTFQVALQDADLHRALGAGTGGSSGGAWYPECWVVSSELR